MEAEEGPGPGKNCFRAVPVHPDVRLYSSSSYTNAHNLQILPKKVIICPVSESMIVFRIKRKCNAVGVYGLCGIVQLKNKKVKS